MSVIRAPFDGAHSQDKLLLAIPSPRRSLTCEPKPSASTYSQRSWSNSPVSPVNFSEARVDPRRFAIVISPSQDGPWKRSFSSADAPTSLLKLQETQSESNAPLAGNEFQHEERNVQEKKERKRTRSLRLKKPLTIPRSESMSAGVLGKMFSRRPADPSCSTSAVLDPVVIIGVEQPTLPPQISISLPSPELNIIDNFEGSGGDDGAVVGSRLTGELDPIALQPGPSLPCMPKHLAVSVPELRESTLVIPHSAYYLSTWKPKRPPSPVPRGMRRNSKIKRTGKTVNGHASPPPPVPSLKDDALVPKSHEGNFSIPSSPPPPYMFHSLLESLHDYMPDDEMILRMRLKARASKSATYASHGDGMFSPALSIL